MRARAGRAGEAILASLVPALLAFVATGLMLLILGRDPLEFYSDMFERGLLEWPGLQESIIRMSPLLLIAAGLIVAFRANLWNLGADGQFLLNDRPVYLRSVLSQGFWPQSHLAAPSAAALRDEVQLILDLGFNAARLHQKAEIDT